MSEPTTATAPAPTTPAPPATAEPTFAAITSQEEFDKRISERINRERAKYGDYDDLKAKAAEFDKVTEAQKTEAQKATERAEKAEREAAEHQTALLRYQVAADKKIPAELVKFLTGSDKAEMEASADALLEHLKPPVAPFEHGPRATATAASANDQMNGLIRRTAGRE